jgi:hypothetical protein
MLGADPFDRRLQLSGIILILGLVVEALCLLGHGPIAFLLFVGMGGALFATGIFLYLYSLVSTKAEPSKQSGQLGGPRRERQ